MKNLKVHFSPEARDDLDRIWDYVSEFSVSSADKAINNLIHIISLIADYPFMGIHKDHKLPGLRSFPYRKYIIYYTVSEIHINILRIIHSALDPDNRYTFE